MNASSDDSGAGLDEQAVRLLITPTALGQLTPDDAAKVVAYMQPRWIKEGSVFVREGEVQNSDHMLLVLEGELSVESSSLDGDDDDMVVRVMGPGSLIGELALLDGAPRSASCIANTDLLVATLTRSDFLRLLQEEPMVGARLLLAISIRMADHLRQTTRKLKLFAQMNKVLSEELSRISQQASTASAGPAEPVFGSALGRTESEPVPTESTAWPQTPTL